VHGLGLQPGEPELGREVGAPLQVIPGGGGEVARVEVHAPPVEVDRGPFGRREVFDERHGGVELGQRRRGLPAADQQQPTEVVDQGHRVEAAAGFGRQHGRVQGRLAALEPVHLELGEGERDEQPGAKVPALVLVDGPASRGRVEQVERAPRWRHRAPVDRGCWRPVRHREASRSARASVRPPWRTSVRSRWRA